MGKLKMTSIRWAGGGKERERERRRKSISLSKGILEQKRKYLSSLAEVNTLEESWTGSASMS